MRGENEGGGEGMFVEYLLMMIPNLRWLFLSLAGICGVLTMIETMVLYDPSVRGHQAMQVSRVRRAVLILTFIFAMLAALTPSYEQMRELRGMSAGPCVQELDAKG